MNYKEIGDSILLFENAFSDNLHNRLLSFFYSKKQALKNIDKNKFSNQNIKQGYYAGSENRLEVYDNKEIFNEFVDYWNKNIEDIWLEYFLHILEDPSGKQRCKNHCATRWKDLFIQLYDSNKITKDNNPVHFDFSGLSFSYGLDCNNSTGGELFFPRQNTTYKLKDKQLLIFFGGITHPHEVKKVTDGLRLVMVGQTLGPPQTFELGKKLNKNIL